MKDSISNFVSKLTLLTQQECSAFLFSPVTIELDYERTLQGFSISTKADIREYKEEIIEILKEFDDLFVNHHNSSKHELLFVKGNVDALNKWYYMMHEGNISTEVIRRCGGMESMIDMDADERRKIILEVKSEMTDYYQEKV